MAQDRGHEQREVDHGAADCRLHPAVDRIGAEHEPRPEASVGAALLIDAAERVVDLGEADRHAVELRSEPAHREEDAASHLAPPRLREDATRARDVDRHPGGGGIVPEPPSQRRQSREPGATGSNTCSRAVP